jgi:pilus assembly protein Flp/PilA
MESIEMSRLAQRFWAEEDGVTAIEYGLIAALIAIVIVASLVLAGSNLNILWNKIAGCLSNAAATPATGC